MTVQKGIPALVVAVAILWACSEEVAAPPPAPAPGARPVKLYWFIPDGLRAEPDEFTIFRWAEEGHLPNLKKLMSSGAWGYSIPDFPSHTPVNFASLLTGARPRTHGISDGPMHTEGHPLDAPSIGGFAAPAKRVPAAWSIFEGAGRRVALLSVPGSTPPQIRSGIVIRGRWGPWGFDTPAILFEPTAKLSERGASAGLKLFTLGRALTQFVEKRAAAGWPGAPASEAPPFEATLGEYGLTLHAYVYDATPDGKATYDTVLFSLDRKAPFAVVRAGAWSEWLPVTLSFKGEPVASHVKIKVIRLWPNGDFRIRFFFNNVNAFLTEPSSVARELTEGVGPMVDFADNWPGQLVFEPEDRATFKEEAEMSLDWHARAAGFILRRYRPDVFIHDTYTPNQMLEARWWIGRTVKDRTDYDEADARAAWDDIRWMYEKVDAVLGEAMKNADADTLVVFSSDHGVIPIFKRVHLNNLFARKGWLEFRIDPVTGEPTIDWAKTRVVYLKMMNVYVRPEGLGGPWTRGSGPEYDRLRDEVARAIAELGDDGASPLVRAVKREDAPAALGLPEDRVGDLVLEARPGYQWWEAITSDLSVFSVPLGGGYKQGVDPAKTKGVWTPFVIAGPGVKRGVALGEPIRHIDQLPTILKLMGVGAPAHVEGRVLTEILE